MEKIGKHYYIFYNITVLHPQTFDFLFADYFAFLLVLSFWLSSASIYFYNYLRNGFAYLK